ncbi:hypothetical protein J4212_04605 [Candidatus Woesearchaeota archaeon]|nr:hypothetical protein [Candidatus Woesearchaeota archaeon]
MVLRAEREVLNKLFCDFSKEACKKIPSEMSQRMEAVERWANFVRDNPDKWKKIQSEFIDAQFSKSNAFIKRLLKQKGGREKVIELYGIKNLKGYKDFLG